jgi:hypothetical protein
MRMVVRTKLFTIADVTIAIVGALVNDITCNATNGTTNGSASFTVTGLQQLLLQLAINSSAQ